MRTSGRWEESNVTSIKRNDVRERFVVGRSRHRRSGALVRPHAAQAGDEVRYESPASEELQINPSELIPSSPSNLQAVATKESVVLVWNEPDDTWIKGYRIYRETDKKKGFVFIGEISTPSFTDTDMPLTKRNYRVTAIGPVKESPAAEIKNIVYIKPK